MSRGRLSQPTHPKPEIARRHWYLKAFRFIPIIKKFVLWPGSGPAIEENSSRLVFEDLEYIDENYADVYEFIAVRVG